MNRTWRIVSWVLCKFDMADFNMTVSLLSS